LPVVVIHLLNCYKPYTIELEKTKNNDCTHSI
jgi:hypothetical protein